MEIISYEISTAKILGKLKANSKFSSLSEKNGEKTARGIK